MKSNRIPTWAITGVCTEARELKNKEGKTWLYVVKLMALGGIYELQTKDETVFKTFGEGSEYEASGSFDHFNGKIKFELKQAKVLA